MPVGFTLNGTSVVGHSDETLIETAKLNAIEPFAYLSDVLARTGALPSALTFITGPSRTADIELTPVRGAHGPTSVKVYLLR